MGFNQNGSAVVVTIGWADKLNLKKFIENVGQRIKVRYADLAGASNAISKKKLARDLLVAVNESNAAVDTNLFFAALGIVAGDNTQQSDAIVFGRFLRHLGSESILRDEFFSRLLQLPAPDAMLRVQTGGYATRITTLNASEIKTPSTLVAEFNSSSSSSSQPSPAAATAEGSQKGLVNQIDISLTAEQLHNIEQANGTADAWIRDFFAKPEIIEKIFKGDGHWREIIDNLSNEQLLTWALNNNVVAYCIFSDKELSKKILVAIAAIKDNIEFKRTISNLIEHIAEVHLSQQTKTKVALAPEASVSVDSEQTKKPVDVAAAAPAEQTKQPASSSSSSSSVPVQAATVVNKEAIFSLFFVSLMNNPSIERRLVQANQPELSQGAAALGSSSSASSLKTKDSASTPSKKLESSQSQSTTPSPLASSSTLMSSKQDLGSSTTTTSMAISSTTVVTPTSLQQSLEQTNQRLFALVDPYLCSVTPRNLPLPTNLQQCLLSHPDFLLTFCTENDSLNIEKFRRVMNKLEPVKFIESLCRDSRWEAFFQKNIVDIALCVHETLLMRNKHSKDIKGAFESLFNIPLEGHVFSYYLFKAFVDEFSPGVGRRDPQKREKLIALFAVDSVRQQLMRVNKEVFKFILNNFFITPQCEPVIAFIVASDPVLWALLDPAKQEESKKGEQGVVNTYFRAKCLLDEGLMSTTVRDLPSELKTAIVALIAASPRFFCGKVWGGRVLESYTAKTKRAGNMGWTLEQTLFTNHRSDYEPQSKDTEPQSKHTKQPDSTRHFVQYLIKLILALANTPEKQKEIFELDKDNVLKSLIFDGCTPSEFWDILRVCKHQSIAPLVLKSPRYIAKLLMVPPGVLVAASPKDSAAAVVQGIINFETAGSPFIFEHPTMFLPLLTDDGDINREWRARLTLSQLKKLTAANQPQINAELPKIYTNNQLVVLEWINDPRTTFENLLQQKQLVCVAMQNLRVDQPNTQLGKQQFDAIFKLLQYDAFRTVAATTVNRQSASYVTAILSGYCAAAMRSVDSGNKQIRATFFALANGIFNIILPPHQADGCVIIMSKEQLCLLQSDKFVLGMLTNCSEDESFALMVSQASPAFLVGLLHRAAEIDKVTPEQFETNILERYKSIWKKLFIKPENVTYLRQSIVVLEGIKNSKNLPAIFECSEDVKTQILMSLLPELLDDKSNVKKLTTDWFVESYLGTFSVATDIPDVMMREIVQNKAAFQLVQKHFGLDSDLTSMKEFLTHVFGRFNKDIVTSSLPAIESPVIPRTKVASQTVTDDITVSLFNSLGETAVLTWIKMINFQELSGALKNNLSFALKVVENKNIFETVSQFLPAGLQILIALNDDNVTQLLLRRAFPQLLKQLDGDEIVVLIQNYPRLFVENLATDSSCVHLCAILTKLCDLQVSAEIRQQILLQFQQEILHMLFNLQQFNITLEPQVILALLNAKDPTFSSALSFACCQDPVLVFRVITCLGESEAALSSAATTSSSTTVSVPTAAAVSSLGYEPTTSTTATRAISVSGAQNRLRILDMFFRNIIAGNIAYDNVFAQLRADGSIMNQLYALFSGVEEQNKQMFYGFCNKYPEFVIDMLNNEDSKIDVVTHPFVFANLLGQCSTSLDLSNKLTKQTLKKLIDDKNTSHADYEKWVYSNMLLCEKVVTLDRNKQPTDERQVQLILAALPGWLRSIPNQDGKVDAAGLLYKVIHVGAKKSDVCSSKNSAIPKRIQRLFTAISGADEAASSSSSNPVVVLQTDQTEAANILCGLLLCPQCHLLLQDVMNVSGFNAIFKHSSVEQQLQIVNEVVLPAIVNAKAVLHVSVTDLLTTNWTKVITLSSSIAAQILQCPNACELIRDMLVSKQVGQEVIDPVIQFMIDKLDDLLPQGNTSGSIVTILQNLLSFNIEAITAKVLSDRPDLVRALLVLMANDRQATKQLMERNPSFCHAVLANAEWYKASALDVVTLAEWMLDPAKNEFMRQVFADKSGNVSAVLQQLRIIDPTIQRVLSELLGHAEEPIPTSADVFHPAVPTEISAVVVSVGAVAVAASVNPQAGVLSGKCVDETLLQKGTETLKKLAGEPKKTSVSEVSFSSSLDVGEVVVNAATVPSETTTSSPTVVSSDVSQPASTAPSGSEKSLFSALSAAGSSFLSRITTKKPVPLMTQVVTHVKKGKTDETKLELLVALKYSVSQYGLDIIQYSQPICVPLMTAVTGNNALTLDIMVLSLSTSNPAMAIQSLNDLLTGQEGQKIFGFFNNQTIFTTPFESLLQSIQSQFEGQRLSEQTTDHVTHICAQILKYTTTGAASRLAALDLLASKKDLLFTFLDNASLSTIEGAGHITEADLLYLTAKLSENEQALYASRILLCPHLYKNLSKEVALDFFKQSGYCGVVQAEATRAWGGKTAKECSTIVSSQAHAREEAQLQKLRQIPFLAGVLAHINNAPPLPSTSAPAVLTLLVESAHLATEPLVNDSSDGQAASLPKVEACTIVERPAKNIEKDSVGSNTLPPPPKQTAPTPPGSTKGSVTEPDTDTESEKADSTTGHSEVEESQPNVVEQTNETGSATSVIPPPPPMPNFISSARSLSKPAPSEGDGLNKGKHRKGFSPVGPGERGGLMASVQKGIKLKSASDRKIAKEPLVNPNKSEAQSALSVAEILARRIAIQDSESESESDNGEWSSDEGTKKGQKSAAAAGATPLGGKQSATVPVNSPKRQTIEMRIDAKKPKETTSKRPASSSSSSSVASLKQPSSPAPQPPSRETTPPTTPIVSTSLLPLATTVDDPAKHKDDKQETPIDLPLSSPGTGIGENRAAFFTAKLSSSPTSTSVSVMVVVDEIEKPDGDTTVVTPVSNETPPQMPPRKPAQLPITLPPTEAPPPPPLPRPQKTGTGSPVHKPADDRPKTPPSVTETAASKSDPVVTETPAPQPQEHLPEVTTGGLVQ